ncbi:glycosyltransferase [Schaedlerella arabinosiphila]|jgi:glycosyltransferase involved in cell wall biosynthesis|uniref:Glycosyltransferase n=1 Tax=Schaedlerella arabinosiphila TaxID=2044587 RepID=A0A3R8M0R3_9FIRM|nr:glycosyltransferase [Schaedlerella arabinosiphila]RRK33390.1 glycosyltransferase [Schaedlerella arabinosiphila]
MQDEIAILIPAYKPDRVIFKLCNSLCGNKKVKLIVVDDGSGNDYECLFSKLSTECVVLTHSFNRGKGAALKTGFDYILENFPMIVGCVTADADGQHTIDDILNCAYALLNNKNSLIMGCRTFDGEDIPWKSKIGNKLTSRLCKYFIGLDLLDTQTGLRGIPVEFMKCLIETKGERYEFEMNMLIESQRYDVPIIEIPIETVYENNNIATHFNPFLDSLRIYKVLGTVFLRYVFSSLSSSVLDIVLFGVLYSIWGKWNSLWVIPCSTALARIVSSLYNYLINYIFVFDSKEKKRISYVKYMMLVILQMTMSAVLVLAISIQLKYIPEVAIKVFVDTILFFISYKIQQIYIF